MNNQITDIHAWSPSGGVCLGRFFIQNEIWRESTSDMSSAQAHHLGNVIRRVNSIVLPCIKPPFTTCLSLRQARVKGDTPLHFLSKYLVVESFFRTNAGGTSHSQTCLSHQVMHWNEWKCEFQRRKKWWCKCRSQQKGHIEVSCKIGMLTQGLPTEFMLLHPANFFVSKHLVQIKKGAKVLQVPQSGWVECPE